MSVSRAFKVQCWLTEWIERLHRWGGSQINALIKSIVFESGAWDNILCKGHRDVVRAGFDDA